MRRRTVAVRVASTSTCRTVAHGVPGWLLLLSVWRGTRCFRVAAFTASCFLMVLHCW